MQIYAKDEDSLSDDFYRITGLNASRGVCVVSESGRKAVFVDGRYTLAACRVISYDFEIIDYTYSNIKSWIKKNILPKEQIIFDWNIYTVSAIKQIQIPEYNFIGKDFRQAESQTRSNIFLLDIALAGQLYTEKFNRISHIFSYGDALLLSDSASICWLFNIRGKVDPYSLSINAYAIIHKTGRAILFIEDRIDIPHIEVMPLNALKNEILKPKTIISDPDTLICKIASYRDDYVFRSNPCLVEKAIKNDVELKNMQQIHIYDSVAVTKFLCWLDCLKYEITELDAANKLQDFRKQNDRYINDSFECISAADEHAAEIHFHTSEGLNKPIKGMYLCDSGGQYYGGTTDITRTVCLNTPTSEQMDRYTRVLMGHIDVFLSTPNTDNVDELARRYLQEIGLDYAHGTGHGVGYMSHVHEGPVGIYRTKSASFTPGIILSNEPGYYKANEYGIRIENMMYVDYTCHFRSLTLVPYCRKLIDYAMLSEAQKCWLQAYNKETIKLISPYLTASEKEWLAFQVT